MITIKIKYVTNHLTQAIVWVNLRNNYKNTSYTLTFAKRLKTIVIGTINLVARARDPLWEESRGSGTMQCLVTNLIIRARVPVVQELVLPSNVGAQHNFCKFCSIKVLVREAEVILPTFSGAYLFCS